MATREFRPDVILLDYMLPDINGNIVCERIKSDSELMDTRIIIISGDIRQEDIDGLIEAGAESFLPKPLEMSQLIERLLGHAHI